MENEIQVMKPAQLQFFGSTEGFELCQRMAKVFATSTLVPTQYQNNMSNCIIAMEMASRIGASPLQVMQNLYIVHGNPGFSAKFLIACINASGKFSPLRYEFKGTENTDDWSCRAYAVDKEGEVLHGAWVSIKMAKAEGWYGKNGSKWQTMPQLMLQYRAAAFFQRTYAPEISLGMQSAEELYDEAELAAAAILMWGTGDAAAALVGIPFGKHKVKCRMTDGKKSWEGTLAMVAVSFAVGFLVLILTQETELSRVLLLSAAGALVGAATELFSPSELDTVTVPVGITAVLLVLSSIV